MKLPDDVFKLILNKLLRLILDEVEDDNRLSLKRERSVYESLYDKYIKTTPKYYQSSNNIDFIIKLLRAKNIGVDPNTKNYKNNTILYLLINEALCTSYLGIEDTEYQILLDKINLLHKYGANKEIGNSNGNTIAHLLISTYVTRHRNWDYGYELNIIDFLQNLGMNINNIKNNVGHTAYDIGKIFITSNFDPYTALTYQSQLNTLLFREREIKFNKLSDVCNKLVINDFNIK